MLHMNTQAWSFHWNGYKSGWIWVKTWEAVRKSLGKVRLPLPSFWVITPESVWFYKEKFVKRAPWKKTHLLLSGAMQSIFRYMRIFRLWFYIIYLFFWSWFIVIFFIYLNKEHSDFSCSPWMFSKKIFNQNILNITFRTHPLPGSKTHSETSKPGKSKSLPDWTQLTESSPRKVIPRKYFGIKLQKFHW